MRKMILVGACGRMGRVVAGQSYQNGFEVVAGIGHCGEEGLPFPVYEGFDKCRQEADVIVDFSHPAVLNDLLSFATERRLPLIIATTGMTGEQIEDIKKATLEIPIFFSFNMSLGVSLLVKLVRQAAAALGEGFDVEIVERHHNQKVDAPSGTALMLADAAKEGLPYTPGLVYERESRRQKRGAHEIGIHSVRGGNIVGEHDVLFAGTDELFTISHSARSRTVFATGAYKAAHFIIGKAPGLYTMEDLV